MPLFRIDVTNSTFRTSIGAKQHEEVGIALQSAIEGAVAIAADEINAEAQAAVVEICVSDLDNVMLLRSAVSVSVLELLVS